MNYTVRLITLFLCAASFCMQAMNKNKKKINIVKVACKPAKLSKQFRNYINEVMENFETSGTKRQFKMKMNSTFEKFSEYKRKSEFPFSVSFLLADRLKILAIKQEIEKQEKKV